MKALFLNLAAVLPQEALDLKVFGQGDCGTLKSKEQLHALLDVLTSASKIAYTAVYLSHRYFGGKRESFVDAATSALKQDVVVATTVLKSAASMLFLVRGPQFVDLFGAGALFAGTMLLVWTGGSPASARSSPCGAAP